MTTFIPWDAADNPFIALNPDEPQSLSVGYATPVRSESPIPVQSKCLTLERDARTRTAERELSEPNFFKPQRLNFAEVQELVQEQMLDQSNERCTSEEGERLGV